MIQSVHSSNTFSWVVESHIARCSFHTNGWSHQQKQCSLLWCWLQQRQLHKDDPLMMFCDCSFQWSGSSMFGTAELCLKPSQPGKPLTSLRWSQDWKWKLVLLVAPVAMVPLGSDFVRPAARKICANVKVCALLHKSQHRVLSNGHKFSFPLFTKRNTVLRLDFCHKTTHVQQRMCWDQLSTHIRHIDWGIVPVRYDKATTGSENIEWCQFWLLAY